MRVLVNGKEETLVNIRTLKELLTAFCYQDEFLAVALNLECIPRHQYEATIIKENDAIEILSPMQGG